MRLDQDLQTVQAALIFQRTHALGREPEYLQWHLK